MFYAFSLVNLMLFVHSVDVFSEGLYIFGLDSDSGVIHVSEPVAQCCSLVGAQFSVFHFLHVDVGNNWFHWRTHGTSLFLSVKLVIVLEVGGVEAKVHQGKDLFWIKADSVF